jgi:hypothetical protein
MAGNQGNRQPSRTPDSSSTGGGTTGGGATGGGASGSRSNGSHESSDRVVHLRAARPWSGDLERARYVLDEGLPTWLGRPLAERSDANRPVFETDLILPLQAPGTAFVFRKAALVEIGEIAPEGAGFRVEVSWRSATLAPLFPVFVGNLALVPGRIVLDGFYAPPGGEVGVILDRALLNMAARRTAGWFISRVTDAIGE